MSTSTNATLPIGMTPPMSEWKITKTTPTVDFCGNTYYWCNLCNSGKGCYVKYHDAKGHHKWVMEHNAKVKVSTGATPIATFATNNSPAQLPIQRGTVMAMQEEYDNDDFILFGGAGALACLK